MTTTFHQDSSSMVMPKSADTIIHELIYEAKIVGTMCTIGKNGAKFVVVHNIGDRFHTGYGDHPNEAKAHADEAAVKYLAAQNLLSCQQLASYALFRLGKDWPTVPIIAPNTEQSDLRTKLDELYCNTANGTRHARSPDGVSSDASMGNKKRKMPTFYETSSKQIKQDHGSENAAMLHTLPVGNVEKKENEQTGPESTEKPMKRVAPPSVN